MRKRFIIAFLALCSTYAVQAQQLSPRQRYPGLFEAVQSSNIYPDNKTFVDAVPKNAPSVIMQNYNREKGKPAFSLKDFVSANFNAPDAGNHGFKTNIGEGVRKHIDTLWQVLQRKPDAGNTSSLLPLPFPYIVPGGRFREVYYWDSYFTMLGLQQSHQVQVIKNMISNFAYLIDHYGFIPNGNRTYYLSRSQPPFFCMMINLLAHEQGNKVLLTYQPQLLKEYQYWMDGYAEIKPGEAKNRVAVMPGGEILNRYWDASVQPREESYIKDVNAGKTTKQQLPVFYSNIRAAAASGWDFSSRWFDAGQQLSSIQTTQIVPVDLNCLLYKLELTLADAYHLAGNTNKQKYFLNKASKRKAAIQKYCWDESTGWFNDYNVQLKQQSPVQTLAAAFPLEFDIATPAQAQKIAAGLQNKFLKSGGLVTTLNHTGQQWDAPNGWAPLQYMAIDGLSKYQQNALAKNIAERWIKLNIQVFNQTGKLLEKYNVEDLKLKAGGGEYPLQDGFGWTNGVLLTLMNRYNVK